MEILVRKKNSIGWMKATEVPFPNEAKLQDILYRSPDIIPVEKMGDQVCKPRIFIKEAGLPGSGNTDLIGIDEYGGIMVVECKLAGNREVRRAVIGQVFEYAAYLWRMGYAEFDSMCCKAEKWQGACLLEAMRQRMEMAGEDWDGEGFEEAVAATLEQGDFRLVVAVNELNDELKRIIEFLNSRADNSAQIYALELRPFESEDLEMLVPDLLAPALPQKSIASRNTTPMLEEDFLAAANDATRVLYGRLKQLAGESDIFGQSSFGPAGFLFRCGKKVALLLRAPGALRMYIGPTYVDAIFTEEMVAEYWAELFKLPAFENKRDSKEPDVVVDASWSEAEMAQLLSALRVLGQGWGGWSGLR